MTTLQGRGAWPSSGTGGTLKSSKGVISPGPYYMLHPDVKKRIGYQQTKDRSIGKPLALNQSAVWHGVIGIQALLNRYTIKDIPLSGIYDDATFKSAVYFQGKNNLAPDGVIGKKTMQALLLPLVKERANKVDVGYIPIFGILVNEGALDPGAVGGVDPDDLGLAQINLPSHPEISVSEAFCPSFATNFVTNYYKNSLDEFNGDIGAAIASYNLGISGTRQWIAAGSPDVWTPPWAKGPRDVRKYINRILAAGSV